MTEEPTGEVHASPPLRELSPADIGQRGAAARPGVAWAAAAIVTATLMLAALNAASAARWEADARPSRLTVALAPAVDGWAGLTRGNLGAPGLWLRQAWSAAKEARFPGAADSAVQASGSAPDQRKKT